MARPKKEMPKRKNGIYEVKVTVGHTFDGNPIRKSFYSNISKADAKAKAQEYIVNQEVIAAVGVTEETASDILFCKWADKWLEVYKKQHVSAQTFALTYKNSVETHIKPFFGQAKLKNIRNIDVQNFFTQKQNDLSQSMLDKLHLCLNGIFETAIDNDLIYKNRCRNVVYASTKGKRTKHVWNDDEIAIAKSYFKSRRPEVYLMLETGLRRGEALGLMWSDIDFDNKTLSVERTSADKIGGGAEIRPPKWDSYRTIPISTELCDFLSDLPHKSLYIFPNNKNSLQVPNTFSQDLEKAMSDFTKIYPNIQPLTAHELRHTRGTELRRKGTDIYTIQKLMGHKDINVTANIYVHNEVESARKAAKII